ncbi:MAG: PAS domain S-box protein, partial [Bacteroidetes bacterium]|nr:PAS domain S-box protein [Bacteroidota bacterium]
MMKIYDKKYVTILNQISLGIILLYLLYHISQKNYLLFHSITELASIVIAWSLFVIVWNTRGILKNEVCIFIGVDYLFIGGLDLLHTLSYKGMGVFSTELEANLSAQLWIVARYIEAGALLFVPFSLSKQIKFSSIFALFFLVTASGLSAIWWGIFPDCYIEGAGLTEFKKNSEYIIIGLLVATLFFLYLKQNLFEKTVYYFLILSVIFTILAELAFTFYVSVYGFSNLVGHLCKIVSFYCLYKALIKEVLTNPYNLMFKEVSEKEKRYRQMFETNTAVKLIIDPKSGNIVEANKAACNFYGYSEAEIQNIKISNITILSPEEIACEMEKA